MIPVANAATRLQRLLSNNTYEVLDTPVCSVLRPVVVFKVNRQPSTREVQCNRCDATGDALLWQAGGENKQDRYFCVCKDCVKSTRKSFACFDTKHFEFSSYLPSAAASPSSSPTGKATSGSSSNAPTNSPASAPPSTPPGNTTAPTAAGVPARTPVIATAPTAAGIDTSGFPLGRPVDADEPQFERGLAIIRTLNAASPTDLDALIETLRANRRKEQALLATGLAAKADSTASVSSSAVQAAAISRAPARTSTATRAGTGVAPAARLATSTRPPLRALPAPRRVSSASCIPNPFTKPTNAKASTTKPAKVEKPQKPGRPTKPLPVAKVTSKRVVTVEWTTINRVTLRSHVIVANSSNTITWLQLPDLLRSGLPGNNLALEVVEPFDDVWMGFGVASVLNLLPDQDTVLARIVHSRGESVEVVIEIPDSSDEEPEPEEEVDDDDENDENAFHRAGPSSHEKGKGKRMSPASKWNAFFEEDDEPGPSRKARKF